MGIKVGDKVRLLNETGEGIVTALSGECALVKVEGFATEYRLAELIPVVKEQGFAELEKVPPGGKDEDARSKYSQPHQQRKRRPYPELDLHIDKLVEDYIGLSNNEILQIQMQHFTGFLKQAIENGEKKVVFIHGVGEGILRHQLRKALEDYPNVTYEDASFSRYGVGATEVIIH